MASLQYRNMEDQTNIALKLPGTSGTPVEISGPTGAKDSLLDPSKNLTLADLVNAALPLVFLAAGLALFGYLLYGGFKYLTSLGDDAAIAEAKGTITYALIGFGLVITAYFITKIFAALFSITIF